MAVSTDATEPGVVLEASGISKSFPGVKALDDVSLTVRRGRLHALLGENGAGKSTLMNVLAGVFPPDRGEVMLEGKPVSFRNPREAREAGIAIIFQELNLIPHLTVAQNIFLGREPLTRAGLIDDARMNREAVEWLRRLKLEVAPETPVAGLRVGQQQVVEIAKALSMRARVIIMDEPTSAITGQEVAVLHDLIRQLKREGVAIIYITHKLDELPLIADEFTVMRDGRCVGSKAAGAASHDEIVRMMVGRDLSDMFSRKPAEPGEEVLRVEGLDLAHPGRAGDFAVRDVSLTLRRGEVLGVFGLMGAGRTELLETLFGLHPKRARGKVVVEGREVWFQSPRHAIDAGVVLAPEDRKREGLVLSLSVAANTSLACIEKTERLGLLDSARESELADGYVRRLRTKTPSVHQLARNLSGGNQQKVVLAKWLATQPKVLLLDEPTRGIDINAKKEIYALMDELVASGLGVVLVSSELPEILAVADRIVVMSEGRKTAEFTRAEANEENIMKAALPRN
ncbi:MAG: sugar ABC transporter ATP-binding protein [Limisphaerales bacterium]